MDLGLRTSRTRPSSGSRNWRHRARGFPPWDGDLAFWKDRLLKEGLLPAESRRPGPARRSIAADSKYAGVRFRELSFSVVVSRPQKGRGRTRPAWYVRSTRPGCSPSVSGCSSRPPTTTATFACRPRCPRPCTSSRGRGRFRGRDVPGPPPPGRGGPLHVAAKMAGKGLSFCPRADVGQVATASCSLRDSEAIPRRIRSFRARTRWRLDPRRTASSFRHWRLALRRQRVDCPRGRYATRSRRLIRGETCSQVGLRRTVRCTLPRSACRLSEKHPNPSRVVMGV